MGGISMIMYGREAQADALIDQLLLDKDPILRYGGMYTIAMAYCGTGNNDAIRQLLHVAVSDVSDDVRRAAVICLGFLLSGQPEQCPTMVSLLAQSYNPHVRYGATMAVGIACAGTALPEALDLLIPMTTDTVDFVCQGALIALSMVLIQVTRSQEPRVERVRKLFEEKVSTKLEPIMSKWRHPWSRYHRRWWPQLYNLCALALWSSRPVEYGWFGCIHSILVLVPSDPLYESCLYPHCCDWFK